MSDTEKVRPFIRASTKYKRLYINPATHDLLGKPPFYEFLLDNEKKRLIIVPVWKARTESYPIPVRDVKNQRRELVLRRYSFFMALTKKFGWQANITYKFFGEYIPEYNIIVFQMANPIIKEDVSI